MLLFTMSDGSVHSGRERRYLEHVFRMRAWYAKEATMEIGALRRPNTPDTLDVDAKKYLEKPTAMMVGGLKLNFRIGFARSPRPMTYMNSFTQGLSLSWPAMGRLPARKRVSTS
jgi:hypothetical protein